MFTNRANNILIMGLDKGLFGCNKEGDRLSAFGF